MSASDMARVDAVVHGRVQAVGFRVFTARKASDLGLSGWVSNLPDGSVRCVAQGPRHSVKSLIVALRQGPTGARVERVTEAWSAPLDDAGGFRIRSHAHAGD